VTGWGQPFALCLLPLLLAGAVAPLPDCPPDTGSEQVVPMPLDLPTRPDAAARCDATRGNKRRFRRSAARIAGA